MRSNASAILVAHLQLCAAVLALAGPTSAQDVRTLHVDIEHAQATDAGRASEDRPLRTLGEALERATRNRRAGVQTRIAVAPGTYREAVTLAFHGSSDDPAPPILIEATAPGSVIVSGSDVWDGWQDEGSGRWSHAWPHAWGIADDPSRGARYVAPIVRQREMVFVDGIRLRQVPQRKRVTPGTFYVDERAGRLLASPPEGVHMPTATVEVAVREHGLRLEHTWDVTVSGITVQHAATPWKDGLSAVRVNGGGRIHFEGVVVRENNGSGLWIGEAREIRIRHARLDDNGWDGLRLWRNRDVAVDSTTTNRNNWRGDLGGYYGWSVGNKLHENHGLVIRWHQARGNLSRGLWLDEDNRDVRIEDSDLSNNLGDGLFIEANPGPMTVRRTTLSENDGFGLRLDNSANLTFRNNVLGGNRRGGIEVMGPAGGRTLRNAATGERYQALYGNLTLEANRITGSGHEEEEGLLVGKLEEAAWRRFLGELRSDANTWAHPSEEAVFAVPGERDLVTLERWRALTRQDRTSTFARGGS